MPPRGQPTARQTRIGAELRKLREASGMTSAQAAASLGWERPRVSHIESGRHGVSGERVRHLAAHYSARDTAYVDALARMADDHTKGWWTAYKGVLPPTMLDISEMEHHAAYLQSMQMLAVPGLLQTPDYARSIFVNGSCQLSPNLIEQHIEHRMARRRVLSGTNPTPFTAVVHEAGLRMRYGSRDIVRSQLRHLLEVHENPSVTIRVVPFDIDAFHGYAQSLLHAGGPVPQLDTIQIDNAYSLDFLSADSQLAQCRTLIERASAVALTPVQSNDFIHKVIQEL
ncbi:helix-turn-helix domain-containing protein [Streptomyces uncialis]|uniref:helix-turn-helix domain-containing protein n=1 Tax=Streptomyces uncialis TaxID=1048205 RepID=UPI003408A8D5